MRSFMVQNNTLSIINCIHCENLDGNFHFKIMTSTSLHDKYSNYHYCIVRECKNTSVKTPGKLWIKAPAKINMRNTWLKLAKKDPNSLSSETKIYFCEDHFDLENDMENYMRYKIMGSVKKIRMKPNCIPTKFDNQTERKRKLTPTPDDQHDSKKTAVIPLLENVKLTRPTELSISFFHQDQCSKECPEPSTEKSICDKAVQAQPLQKNASCQVNQHHAHKLIQATDAKHYKSKQVQFSATVKDAISSPIQLISRQSTSTSPIKPSVAGQSLLSKKLVFKEDNNDSDTSYVPSQGGSSLTSSPSKPSSRTTTGSLQENIIKCQKINLHSTLSKIKNNPRLYVGIPLELYFIVGIISKCTKVSETHILLCLMKIRLNRTFSELGDDFDISLSQASKIFYSKLPAIVNVLLPFVRTFTKSSIKKNLPIAFCHKCNIVNSIIDCLEIEIQKPKKSIPQAMTWSEYKKANTIKYFITCTPDGFVSFRSNGYGGRVSDVNLLEHSDFIDSLEPGSFTLADRGFKHIEMYLKQRGFSLLAGSKWSKSKAKQTKEIASLRIHVERVIRRIHEFSILKPHSVVDLKLLHLLDSCVIIACALINIQDSLIK